MAVKEPQVTLKRVSHWIGGRLVEGRSGRSGVVWNPATGQPQATVDFASVEEVDAAVAVAREAYKTWRQTPSPAGPRSCSSSAIW